ncbi:MAG: tetratricopeptide repeat protein [Chitinispirillaceae bacterium]|jgi:tetratricopeptide (TPR) repeat protein|nr:tetratricopeptide repeat protein [Chitinispirillaceae bacterium]
MTNSHELSASFRTWGLWVLWGICFFSFGDEVYSKNNLGNRLYKNKNYEEALRQYDDALLIAPSDSLLKMNKGAALYHLGRAAEAESLYTGALSINDRKKRAAANYNMGNILFRQGEALMHSGDQAAGDKFKDALERYKTALDLQPNDKETKWNLELTQRRIRQQEQQQKNQQKQDKDNKNDQDKKDQKQNQSKQDQNKDPQDKKDQKQKNQENKDSQNDNNRPEQKPQPQPQQSKEEMKKEDARRLIEQYSDDADTLNKPPKKGVGVRLRQPEKDW